MIRHAPKLPALKRIIAARQRHRELFERGESQASHEPRPEYENLAKHEPRHEKKSIPSRESLIIRAADRLRLADVLIWRVERGSPSFVPQQYESLSVDALPPLIGFEDDGNNAAGMHRAVKAAARAGSRK